MKEIAIIGPTASGKSDAAITLAERCNANILSIDSLSIYKEIDIASAKPSLKERAGIPHYGIDLLYPNETFGVALFIDLYQSCKAETEREGKNLIIVGGSSFYLKTLMTGLSQIPQISEATQREARGMLCHLSQAYELLRGLDPEYMHHIDIHDSYRIEKMLHLYLQTGQTPSAWFAANPPRPIIERLPVFNIDIDRDLLRERIRARTRNMLDAGLIEEVTRLEHRYGRRPNSMKSIGISEVLEYLDGLTCKEEMVEKIITHTAQLAKRQQTFNNNQFEEVIHCTPHSLMEQAAAVLS